MNVTVLSHVTPNGKGAQANIKIGEKIISINGNPTKELIHVMAQKMIKNTGQTLTLILEGNGAAMTTSTPAATSATSVTAAGTKGMFELYTYLYCRLSRIITLISISI